MIRRILVLGALILVSQAHDQAIAVQSMTFADLEPLDASDLKRLTLESLRSRAAALTNIRVVTECRVHSARFENGVIGERLPGEYRDIYVYRRLSDSYRMSTTQYRNDGAEVRFKAESGFNAATGRATMFVDHSDRQTNTGRIDSQQDNLLQFNRYLYLLGGNVDDKRNSYIRDVLETEPSLVKVELDETAGLVKLVMHDRYAYNDKRELEPVGTREMWLDPTKGFMLTKMSRYYELTTRDGGKTWRQWKFEVKQSRQINGIWMPTHVYETGRSSAGRNDRITVYESTVTDLELGLVAQDDLRVPLPPGTMVYDAVSELEFVVPGGDDDQVWDAPEFAGTLAHQAKTTDGVANAKTAGAAERNQPRGSHASIATALLHRHSSWLALVGAGVCLAGAMLWFRQRKQHAKS